MHFYYLIFFFLVLILQSWRWKLCWIRLFVLCQLCLLAHLDPLSRKIFCGWGRIGDQHHSVMNTSVRVNCQILLPRMNKNMSGPYIILWLWEKKVLDSSLRINILRIKNFTLRMRANWMENPGFIKCLTAEDVLVLVYICNLVYDNSFVSYKLVIGSACVPFLVC